MKMKLILSTAVLFFVGGHMVEAQKAKRDTIPQDTKIDEIVVVAYGSQKRETMVGSNTEVKAKQFADRPITSIGQALDGASAGVKVSTGTGQPGSSPSIQIRGIGSYGITTNPLYVVDGTVYTGSLAAINPNDIASYNILKDAASTSLYGSAAANGVILITTKSGRKGKDSFNFSMSTGAVGRSTPEYDRVDVYQYYPLIWEAIRNGRFTSNPGLGLAAANNYASIVLVTGNIPFGSGVLKTNVFDVDPHQLVIDGVLNPNAKLKYTDLDWQKPLMNTGFRQNYELNYSGGSNSTTYFSSVGYTNETGYLIKSDFERFTARLKVDSQVKSWLKLGTSISGVSSNGNNSVDGVDNNSAYINPYRWTRTMGPIYSPYAHDPNTFATLYDNDGNIVYDAGSARGADAAAGRNVIQETLLNKDLSKNYYIISRAYAEIKVDPYLTLSTNVGYDIRNNRRSTYGNKIIGDAAPGGSAEKYSFTEQTFTWNQLLNYKRKFGDHNFEFLLGHENYKFMYEYLYGYKKGQIVDGNDELVNFVTLSSLPSYTDTYTKEGVFSRLNYDYKSKYLLSGSIRWDASSRFAKDVRWSSFWSLGAGWRLKGEEFLSNSNLISELKLRGSYGEVGNDRTDSYYMYKSTYTLGYNNAQEPGILFGFLADPTITWETNKQTDVGIDFGFLNNRITGSVEYYNRVTEDLIFPVPLPVSSGVPGNTISRNVGTMYNRGFEFSINADVIKTQNFTWNINANASTLKNQITELSKGITEIINGTKKVSVGHSVYDYWLRQWYGVDPADGSPLFLVADTYANTTATDIRTVNGTKVTTNFNKAKYDYSGSAIPDLFGSFGTSITYKQWSLSTLFTYQLGGKTYDSNYAALMSSFSQGGALSTDILDRWTTPGQITDIPALNSTTYTSSNAASSRWLVSSDFITFRQATLSYSFAPETLSQLGVSGLRILVSGENLWSKTARKGLEPAQAFNGTASNRYTPARIVTIGFNVSF
ncbi:SusC/RagA family TonB-linked outer membrane protein [Chryseobacterium sp. KCF3-3]|uniref:SusC/RagA family TonB-linked outer membrane protein n=1 Tax=Chryseobacterium sp. KCF3-3 TaxID=3231511 RepID=UPI0038B32F75